VKRNITLEIAGAKYRMTSDADEEHLLRLASMVNERIEALGSRAARAASPAQLLAVVALGLAEDLDSAQRRGERIEATTRRVVQTAIERIDRRLAAAAHGEPDSGGA